MYIYNWDHSEILFRCKTGMTHSHNKNNNRKHNQQIELDGSG